MPFDMFGYPENPFVKAINDDETFQEWKLRQLKQRENYEAYVATVQQLKREGKSVKSVSDGELMARMLFFKGVDVERLIRQLDVLNDELSRTIHRLEYRR